MKAAIVYFYNSETCDFIGPLFDIGSRFDKDSCKRRYAIANKSALIIDNDQVME